MALSRISGRVPLSSARLGLLAVLALGLACLIGSPPVLGQPPKRAVEEEEEMPNKARPKVPISIDDDSKGKSAPKAEVANVNLLEEGRLTTSTALKEFYFSLAVPYDLLVTTSDERYKIRPVAEKELPRDELIYFEFNPKMTGGLNRKLAVEGIKELVPFEEVVQREAERFLKNRSIDGSRLDQLEAAVKVMAFAVRFHDSALESRGRTGKGWDLVQDKLRKAHQSALRDFFVALADAKQWDRAERFAGQLANALPDDPDVQRIVYRIQLQKAEVTLGTGSEGDYLGLRDALTQYEKTLTAKDILAENVRKRLREKAAELLSKAVGLANQNQVAAAQGRIRLAEALDPDVPGLSDLRSRLKDRILYVGVSRLPERMSPATARFDSERWAVELLFEGLVQPVPDAELGRRFRPGLAESLPRVISLGRDFQLTKNARWTYDNGKEALDARDVRGTINMLKKRPETWAADGIDLLEGVDKIEDPYHLRLNFKQGIFEPLSRLSFKILPAQYLVKNGFDIDDDRFAKAPFGSGPYRYEGREKEGADRECAVFRANPYYSLRPGKFGLPFTREIRFFVPRSTTLPNEFQSGQLHLMLDVSTQDYVRFRNDQTLEKTVRAVTPVSNRRIWMLAVNHRKPMLQSQELRRGIAFGIDRDEILRTVFRVEGTDSHRAMTGPFPPRCWATPPKSPELYRPELAASELSKFLEKNRKLQVGLKYPAEDLQANRACLRIKEMIEKTAGQNTEIFLQPVPIGDLKRNVEVDHDFELAYIPFDYSDELFRLDGLLDPQTSGRGGRNFLGYLNDTVTSMDRDRRLRQTLQEIRQYRDFNKQVKEKTWEVHQLFVQQMPFIPLWQLDRHLLIANGIEVVFEDPRSPVSPNLIDPAPLFTGVEYWRIK